MDTSGKKAKLAFIGACLAMFSNVGMNSTFALFLPCYLQTWPDKSVATIGLAATVSCLVGFLTSTFVLGPMLRKIQTRSFFAINAVLFAVYCLVNYASTDVWQIVAVGLIGGSTLGLGTNAVGAACVSPYFGVYGNKTPTIIAVVMACGALGGVIFSFVTGQLITAMGWRNTYLVLGVLVVVINIVSLIIVPKENKSSSAAEVPGAVEASDVPGLTAKEARGTAAFWLAFLGILCLALMYLGFTTYLPSCLVSLGISQSNASSVQAIMQMFGIVFIVVGGPLAAKLGVRGLIAFTGIPLAVGCLLFAFVFPNAVSFGLAVVFSLCCITGFAIVNICPLVTAELFGQKNFNQINPVMGGGAYWLGASLSTQVIGRPVAATGSYSTGFAIAAIIGIVGTIVLFVSLAASPMKKRGLN